MLRVLLAAAAVSAPHVVAHVPYGVAAFAQDPRHLVWVDKRDHHLHVVRPDGSHPTGRPWPGYRWDGGLVIAGGIPAWTEWHATNGDPTSDCVVAADRSLRSAGDIAGAVDEGDCLGGSGSRVASDGRTIVAVDGITGALERYDGRRHVIRRGFAALALAVSGRYVAGLARASPPQLYDADVSSTDDTLVAVSSADAFGRSQLDVRRLDGALVRSILRKDDPWLAWPRWSPDGAKVLWTEGSRSTLMIAAADGSGAHAVRGTDDVWKSAWSPDGKTIAYVVAGGAVFTIAASGGSRTSVVAPAHANGVAWSPAGVLTIATDSGIWVGTTRVVASVAWDVAWSPAGDQIAYANADGIHVVRSDGTDDRIITGPSGDLVDYSAPAWSRDGTTIVYTDSRYKATLDLASGETNTEVVSRSLWSVAAAGGAPRLVAEAPTPLTAAVFSRTTGRRIVGLPTPATTIAVGRTFAATGDAHSVVTYALPSGHVLERFSFAHGVNALSASGDRLVVASGHVILTVDPRSRARRLLAHTQGRFAPVGLSIVGNRVAWAENRPHGAVILSLLLR